jgi:hypothetical protein
MNVEYKDYIGIYKGLYPDGYCSHLINEFERLVNSGAGSNRQNSENALAHCKNDMQLGLNVGAHAVAPFNEQRVEDIFFNRIQQCFLDYTKQYSILKDAKISGTTMKMQRTSPGGGYHVWHCEQNNGPQASRVLVYMLYLNTLGDKEGGETEFLYQKTRIAPEENTIIMWPAAFTHPHRGNTVLGEQCKYIATGWFYYD